MTHHAVTTPFGRRPVTLGQIAGQAHARATEPGKTVHKWKVFQAVTAAKDRLALPDRALAVLSALLSFHPETTLTAGDSLVVFPSNESLGARAHGMAAATLRRHLAHLVEAGLVIRRDSPNGKRYCRRAGAGEVAQAFGFDLAPLVARAEEIEALAAAVQAEKAAMRLARERLTLARRDLAKLVALAAAEGLPGDWDGLAARAETLGTGLRRQRALAEIEALAAEAEALASATLTHLESFINSEEMSASDIHSGRHKQNSKPDLSESEPAFQKDRGDGVPAPDTPSPPETGAGQTGPMAGEPARRCGGASLALVLEACPDLVDYMAGPGGGGAPPARPGWPDVLKAAELVRAMLGISPDAWRDAVETMGAADAAIVVAAILQKGDEVRFPGGYLRALTEKKREGSFSTGPILMALVSQRLKRERGARG